MHTIPYNSCNMTKHRLRLQDAIFTFKIIIVKLTSSSSWSWSWFSSQAASVWSAVGRFYWTRAIARPTHWFRIIIITIIIVVLIIVITITINIIIIALIIINLVFPLLTIHYSHHYNIEHFERKMLEWYWTFSAGRDELAMRESDRNLSSNYQQVQWGEGGSRWDKGGAMA